jgi:ParB-like chromosome segregation protein Spo0J
MPDPTAPPALFDVTTLTDERVDGALVRVPLDELELAPNARRQIDPEGIERLARMLASMGQLVPGIGHRPAGHRVVLYAGQRRLLAAQASRTLDGIAPIRSLIVLLLDHQPTPEEIRRIQAHENQREDLTLADQQDQFRDCFAARAGLRDEERIAAVCADLGIGARKAHNLRRQLTLPDTVRTRVAERPADAQISVTMANRLADMHELAPELTTAVAARISSPELHERALHDLGAFVHRTVVEDESVYAVRIDDGALLDAAEQLERARAQLTAATRPQAASLLGCAADKLDRELDALGARAQARSRSTRSCATAPPTAATPGRSTAAATSPAASGSSTRCSCSTPSTSACRPTTATSPPARRATSPARGCAMRTCRQPPSRIADSARRHASVAPRRPRATSDSDTTSAPASPIPPLSSSTPCGGSSATSSQASFGT